MTEPLRGAVAASNLVTATGDAAAQGSGERIPVVRGNNDVGGTRETGAPTAVAWDDGGIITFVGRRFIAHFIHQGKPINLIQPDKFCDGIIIGQFQP